MEKFAIDSLPHLTVHSRSFLMCLVFSMENLSVGLLLHGLNHGQDVFQRHVAFHVVGRGENEAAFAAGQQAATPAVV